MLTRLMVTLALVLTCLGAPLAVAVLAREPAVEAPAAGGPVVEVREGVLPADRARLLEAELRVHAPRRVAVTFVGSAPRGIEPLARERFTALGLGDADVSIAVAVHGREVSAHVGPVLTRRGLDRQAIVAVIGERFKRHARAGDYARAARELADGLLTYEAPRAQAPAAAPSGDREPEHFVESGWFALAVVGALVGGIVALGLFLSGLGRRGRRHARIAKERPVAERIAALQADDARVTQALVALDDAGALARATGDDDPRQAAATAIMGEARAFGERVAALDERHVDDLDTLEMTSINLEAAIAALRTAYEAGHASQDVVRKALVHARRWKTLEAEVSYIAANGLTSSGKLAVWQDQLARARTALTDVPIDRQAANDLLNELQASLKKAGKVKVRPAQALPGGASVEGRDSALSGWDVRPLIITEVVHHHVSHDTAASAGWFGGSESSGSSGSSSWSSDSSSSWDSGSSGSSSWDSGSSGSSSWDSGSSSSDSGSSGTDNW